VSVDRHLVGKRAVRALCRAENYAGGLGSWDHQHLAPTDGQARLMGCKPGQGDDQACNQGPKPHDPRCMMGITAACT
jgi:hypothetical protein